MQRNPETGLPGYDAGPQAHYWRNLELERRPWIVRAQQNTWKPDYKTIAKLWKENANKAESVIKAWQRLALIGAPAIFLTGYVLGAWLGWP